MENSYYHVYNRGAHKAAVFQKPADFERFLELIYFVNTVHRVRSETIRQDKKRALQKANRQTKIVFEENLAPNFTKSESTTRTRLVSIFAYCLMKNHYHLCVREQTKGGLQKFMQKLVTAYTMYYNAAYKHSGTIFQGSYKAKVISSSDKAAIKRVIDYIHLNPAMVDIDLEFDHGPKKSQKALTITEKQIKKIKSDLKAGIEKAMHYKYSSYKLHLEKMQQRKMRA